MAVAVSLLLTLLSRTDGQTLQLERRVDSPTDACKRYSHQSSCPPSRIRVRGLTGNSGTGERDHLHLWWPGDGAGGPGNG